MHVAFLFVRSLFMNNELATSRVVMSLRQLDSWAGVDGLGRTTRELLAKLPKGSLGSFDEPLRIWTMTCHPTLSITPVLLSSGLSTTTW